MASSKRVWRMCERQTDNSFAKCKTKCEVIDVYMSQLESLQSIAQRTYAIDSHECRKYVRLKVGTNYVRHRHRHRCEANNNDTALFSRTSMKNFAKFLAECVRCQLRRHFLHIAICAAVIILVNYKTETSSAFMRNIQTLIYPVMRAWRKITLPLLKLFPSLTNLYDETCLIENPFFRVANLDCTPCIGVVKVIEYSASHRMAYLDYSVPHIVQVNLYSVHSPTNPTFIVDLRFFRLRAPMQLRFRSCFHFTWKIVRSSERMRTIYTQPPTTFTIWINCLTIFSINQTINPQRIAIICGTSIVWHRHGY